MREIKFRAKVIGESNYTYSNGFIKHKDGTVTVIVSIEEDHCCTSPIQEGTLQEYTGINDKNGVEIYEGDQLHVCAGYSSYVEFKDGGFMSIYKHPEDGEELFLSELGNDIEVITTPTKS